MPSDQETLNTWLKKTMDKEAADTRPLSPTLENFKNFIESNPKAYMFLRRCSIVPANEQNPRQFAAGSGLQSYAAACSTS